ncbi:adenylate cyclase [Pararobbsia alpina]|uniref:adenylate/guanylate cyclase domain-containing protein n=1 Tax=Pararobbsia alpina TaxID=621374 RepID=UPI0039A40840
MDIARWLESLGLGQYTQAFVANDIDDAVCGQLTDADLITLGVTSLGHRKRLLAAFAAARADTSSIATGSVENGRRTKPLPVAPPVVERVQASVMSHALDGRSTSDEPGAAGAAVYTHEGDRRFVTVLFADLCGFTSLSRSIDAEELRELVERFTSLVDDIVQAYGGTIDKHIGDAVMALFGAPLAHDTDPLRAARAALDIHAALAAQAEQGLRPLRAHIGIASGEVVAGAMSRGGTRDYTVLGDSVNLAARIVDAAEAGQTLMADSVRRAIGNAVVSEAMGAMQFKGIDEPLDIWRLIAVASAEAQPPARTMFVGRKSELEQFASIAGACLREHAGHVIYLRGEAGIGKTRLVEEMRRHADTVGFAFHRGLVLDFGSGKAQGPVRAVLEGLLGLSHGDDPEARAARVQQCIDTGDIGSDLSVFLNDLLDAPQTGEWRTLYPALDNTTRQSGKRNAIRALVRACCTRSPSLIVVEDLHWADPQTLLYLSALAAGLADAAALLVMTSRVEGDPVDAAWRASCRGVPISTIDLGPLRNDEAMHLAGNFLDATQRIARDCIERAAGNPLFLEQLLRNAEEGHQDNVPASIQSLVLARMDRLSAKDRSAFQAAAVIGQRFDPALLRALIDAPDYTCDALVANALVLPDDGQYLFAHALLQEAAYSTLLRSTRRALHRRAADWFGNTDPVLRAQHLDRAGDSGAALAYLGAAGSLRRAYALDAALRSTTRGIELAADAAQRNALMQLQGEIQRDLGDIAGSIAMYRAALECVPDDAARCRNQIGLADGLRVSEGLQEARSLLDDAQCIAEAHEMHDELAHLHHLRGNILFPIGDVEGCEREHQKGLDCARRIASPEAEARALGGLGDAAYAQGRMRTAFERFSQCVELSHEHGFGRIEVANRSMVGFSRIYLNEASKAAEDALVAARMASMVGQRRAEMLAETLGVFANFELGNRDAMRAHLEREQRLIDQLGARRFEAQNLEMRARLRMDEGAREEAVALLERAIALCREVGMQFSAPKALGFLSSIVDDTARREAALMEGESLLERGAVAHNHFSFYRDAVEATLLARDTDRALAYVGRLEAWMRRETLPSVELFAERARILARVIANPNDQATRRMLESTRVRLIDSGFARYAQAIDRLIVF